MENEMNNILMSAEQRFINPLLNFRKEQIGSVKQSKKDFEKSSGKLCSAQDKYISTSSKKEENLAEMSEIVRIEQKSLNSASLDYVYNIHIVQERKKFEFVEALLAFTRSWVNYYRVGNTVAAEYGAYMEDLATRVEKTRENFSSTVESYSKLKDRMLKNGEDPGLFNKMYTRQGYLYVQARKTMKMTGWSKHFCQYQGKTKTLTLIPYNQIDGKIGTGETLRVINCVCKDEVSEKFRFSVTGHVVSGGGNTDEGGSQVITHTLQALSDQVRKNWVEAMGGTWPAVNTLQRIKADSVEENLNSSAYTFLKDCLQELEDRGLHEEGLYRVGGVMSKVKKLLNQAIDPGPDDAALELHDPKLWESKTLASAVKQYLRDLSKPVLTYQLYPEFIAAVKHDSDTLRTQEIKLVVEKLPRANKELCRVIVNHLHKVEIKSLNKIFFYQKKLTCLHFFENTLLLFLTVSATWGEGKKD
ncbi:rho GTPase-activating protein 42 [Eurytemora carolleeae]|uniref:rho GTPase-activating protein 42 n=1 Tax=Eurytemora carolleeae TaxID=1294199 RepID=UPI000C788FF7|nr:rho GTPase-activating protein 42 [Eurytemora carolleeae]|eukprot:XP_023339907.1 rho GTPase-activating protein 42-like [Eurytemora affinis]